MREVLKYMTDVEGLALSDSRCARLLAFLHNRFRAEPGSGSGSHLPGNGNGTGVSASHEDKRVSSGNLAALGSATEPLVRSAGLLSEHGLPGVLPASYPSSSFASSTTSALWASGRSREVLSALSSVRHPAVPSLGLPTSNKIGAAEIRGSSALENTHILPTPYLPPYFSAGSGSHGDLRPELSLQRCTLPSSTTALGVACHSPYRPFPPLNLPIIDFNLRVPTDLHHKDVTAASAFVTPQSSVPRVGAHGAGDRALHGATPDFAGCTMLPAAAATSAIRT